MNPSPHEAVAAEVRACLARCQLSARSAAEDLGWSQIYLWRRLSGRVAFDVNDLAALAGLLEVPVTAFFELGPGVNKSSTLLLELAA